MQIVFIEGSLHEMSTPIRKSNKKNVIILLSTELVQRMRF